MCLLIVLYFQLFETCKSSLFISLNLSKGMHTSNSTQNSSSPPCSSNYRYANQFYEWRVWIFKEDIFIWSNWAWQAREGTAGDGEEDGLPHVRDDGAQLCCLHRSHVLGCQRRKRYVINNRKEIFDTPFLRNTGTFNHSLIIFFKDVVCLL